MAATVEESEGQIRRMAALLGHPDRGEAMIARIDQAMRDAHVQGEDAAQRGVQDAQDGNAHETSALTWCEDSRNKGTTHHVIA